MTDLSKRPVAFRIRRADADTAGSTLSENDWRYFTNEDDAWKASDALGTEYQGLYVRDGTPFRMPNEERHKLAYDTFRGGLRDTSAIPTWDDAPSWVRDVCIVAYLQGKLDAPKRS